jgi:hypothetical protein
MKVDQCDVIVEVNRVVFFVDDRGSFARRPAVWLVRKRPVDCSKGHNNQRATKLI